MGMSFWASCARVGYRPVETTSPDQQERQAVHPGLHFLDDGCIRGKACGSCPRLWRSTVTPCPVSHLRSLANCASTGSTSTPQTPVEQHMAGSKTSELFHEGFLGLAGLVPAFAGIDGLDDQQHDRHFDQYADNSGQCRTGLETEQADGGSNGQFKKIGGAGTADGQAMLCFSTRFSQ